MPKIVSLIAALALAGLAAACTGPAVPDEPTWTEDVQPIVAGNCIRCHSPPQLLLAPNFLRFDKYAGEDRDGDGQVSPSCFLPDVCGAGSERQAGQTVAEDMADRVSRDEDDPLHMPPDGVSLWQRQIDVIEAWADAGGLEGPARPGNRPPTMELTSDFDTEGNSLVARYQIDDPDFDLVTGRLNAEPEAGGDAVVVTWELFSGEGTIVWDLSPGNGQEDVAPGTYLLTAEIDDVSETVNVDLGSVEVP